MSVNRSLYTKQTCKNTRRNTARQHKLTLKPLRDLLRDLLAHLLKAPLRDLSQGPPLGHTQHTLEYRWTNVCMI